MVFICRVLVVALALAVAAAGCGGDSGSGETSKAKNVFYPWVTGPAREFLVRGGDNFVQYFGHEGTPAEREAVSHLIHRWMAARAAEDWAADCSYFSQRYRGTLVSDARAVTDGRVTSCPAALDYFGENASGDGKNTLTGPIDSLRVKKGRGYAQWHGPEKDWVLPVVKEGDRWAVTVAAPLDRNK